VFDQQKKRKRKKNVSSSFSVDLNSDAAISLGAALRIREAVSMNGMAETHGNPRPGQT
jgi:hypothetical protein